MWHPFAPLPHTLIVGNIFQIGIPDDVKHKDDGLPAVPRNWYLEIAIAMADDARCPGP